MDMFYAMLEIFIELNHNDEQPATNVSDGTHTFSEIVTFVENGPNSGIFDNWILVLNQQ